MSFIKRAILKIRYESHKFAFSTKNKYYNKNFETKSHWEDFFFYIPLGGKDISLSFLFNELPHFLKPSHLCSNS